jgi:hypothetical protein
MNFAFNRRKVAPAVKNGAVQKKHRHHFTVAQAYVLDRESPAKGHRHVLTKRDIREFVGIVPTWEELAVGLESIVLTSKGDDHEGLYRIFQREKTGSIEIPAWEGELWKLVNPSYVDAHGTVFERIGLAFDRAGDDVECRFTHDQARAFLLLHVFMHELGHHVDRMLTKHRRAAVRGEDFAERYANDMLDRLWTPYVDLFGDPSRAHS